MDVMSAKDKKDSKVESYSYKGKPLKVKDVWIRWLTQAGPEDSAEYVFDSLQICNRGYVLENGSVVIEGKGKELPKDENVNKAYLGM